MTFYTRLATECTVESYKLRDSQHQTDLGALRKTMRGDM